MMRDAGRQFVGIVRDYDECHHRVRTIVFDDAGGEQSIGFVEPVEGFVEDEQIRRFDEGTCQEAETLFAAADAEERAVGQVLDAEASHPHEARLALFRARTHIEPHAVVEPAGNDIYGGQVAHVASVHLRADVADVAFDVPDALACASAAPEEFDVAGVGLRIVGTNEAE